MSIGKAVLGIAIIMLAVIVSLPLTGVLRKVGVPVNP